MTNSRPNRTLLRGGVVLTMDRDIGDYEAGDVLIEDGAIVDVAERLNIGDAATIDCTGKIVIPGFVNSHQHMFQTALRGYWSDALEIDYFSQSRGEPGALFHQYTPDDVYWGEYAGALENLAAGTTTVVDTSQCAYTPAHTDAAINGILRSGIRCVFAHSPAFGDFHADPTEAHPDDIRRLIDIHGTVGTDGLLHLALGAHVDEDLFALANELRVPVFAHVNDATWGAVLEDLAGEHALPDRATYIHCLDLDRSSWNTIKESGAAVSVSSSVEQTLVMGEPALQEAHRFDVPVGLGSDTVSLGPADFFSQMRAAYAAERRAVRAALARGEEIDPVTTRDVLTMATLGGARAAHLADSIGSLKPGKRADIVVLDARRLNVAPVTHVTGAIVQQMDTSNVDTVLVDGRVIKRDGRLTDVDLDDVFERLMESAKTIIDSSSCPVITLGSCR